MLQLNIRSYPIRLEYNTINAQVNRKTTLPKVEMETIPPRLEIKQPQGELTIDSTEYYHSIGLKTRATLSREFAAQGKQAALDAIAATVAEGDRLAQIANPANAFAELAFQSRFDPKGELSFEPIAPPDVQYQANPAQIRLIPGKVNYSPQQGIIDANYQRGDVDFRVTHYPDVKISVVDVQV